MPARNQDSEKRKEPSEQIEFVDTVVKGGYQYNNRLNATEQQSSLAMNQTFNSHSIIHIVLSCFTLPLALANLREQYNHIKELKKKKFPRSNQNESLKPKSNDKLTTSIDNPPNDSTKNTTTDDFGESQFFQESYRSPEAINNNLIFIKKAQLASSATNVLLSLIVIGVVISAIFTGGLSLGALAVAAMIMASIKIVMDVHLANKETKLKKEFFESKVLTEIEGLDPQVHEKYKRLIAEEDKTVIMVGIALSKNNPTEYPDSEVIEYVLNQREGYLENAKMRNTQIGFAVLGLGVWLATNYLTLGLAGVILSAGATTLSIVASISNTKFVQNALGSNTTEWFRTFFSRKKGEEFDLYDYKNKEIVSFIKDIKTKSNNLSEFFESYYSFRQLSSYGKIEKNFNLARQTTNADQNNTTEYNEKRSESTPTPPNLKQDGKQNTTASKENKTPIGQMVTNNQQNIDDGSNPLNNTSIELGSHF